MVQSSHPILHLCSSLGLFGAENVLLTLAKELIPTEYTPMIGVIGLFNSQSDSLVHAAEENLIKSVFFPCSGKFDIKTVLAIRKYIKKYGIEIVHSHGYKANFYSLLSSFGISITLIATCHNWIRNSPKLQFYSQLDCYLLKHFNSIVTVSDTLERALIKKGIPSYNIKTIFNGVCLDSFDKEKKQKKNSYLRKILKIPLDCFVIGAVGRLSYEKGFDVFCKSAQGVLKTFPNVRFLIIGNGPQKEELTALCETLGIDDFVNFTGYQNNLKDFYSLMDIFVISSLSEGLPMVLLEAMVSKIPVISTRVGAIPSVIKDHVNGLLVEPNEVVKLRDLIIELLRDRDMAKTYARRAYQTVKEHFSSEVMASNYIDLYRSLERKMHSKR